jgi:bifunctional DNA-binding transcriptional regulator/antitoxin component of YhaV-PrlF toxin-antitoxin module
MSGKGHTQLEVKENIDGELYFDLPDELLNRLGWKEGDEIKFIEKDGGFLLTKVKYESIGLDLEEKDLLRYMMFAHEQDITFNELCQNAIKEKLDELEKEEG